jgi:hypothetical protein
MHTPEFIETVATTAFEIGHDACSREEGCSGGSLDWWKQVVPLVLAAINEAHGSGQPPPPIVCLCGSTRFYDQFQQANYNLTMRGEIVLSVGFYPHAKTRHGHGEGVGHDSAEKAALDELHKRKIDLADYVLVVSDASGYFGQSTQGEIRYAADRGKPVRFAEPAAATHAASLGLTSPIGARS